MIERTKKIIGKVRALNHKEHRKQMYKQWASKVFWVVKGWESSSEFKALKVVFFVGEPDKTYSETQDYVERLWWSFEYKLLDTPSEKDVEIALRRLNLSLERQDFGQLQKGDFLSEFTGEARKFKANIVISSGLLRLNIIEQFSGDKVREGARFYY